MAFDLISFQDRDLEILQGFFECRVMTAAHVATLYFDGSKEAAKKRLQKLKAEGLIGERLRRVNEPSVLFLTRKAFPVLHDRGVLANYPRIAQSSLAKRAFVSDMTLRHELEIMDVKASLHAGISNAEEISIAEFSTWPLLHQFEISQPNSSGAKTLVKPDGFIRIKEKETETTSWIHTFFFELDRSTEVQDTLCTRARHYLDYYSSGGFAERNGASRSDSEKHPFRVLMVFKSAERRNNTAEGLLQGYPPIFTQAWLTTLAEIKADPFGAIWIDPNSYLEATKGTPFDPARRRQEKGYRRQSDRERIVEHTIRKFDLLAPPHDHPNEPAETV